MNKTQAASLLLLLGGVATGAWAYWNGQEQQSAALDKIAELNTRLASNNALGTKANAAVVRELGRAVYYNRNQVKDVAVLRNSQQILTRSASLTDSLRAWQRLLRAEAGEENAGPLRNAAAATALPAARRAILARSLSNYSAFIRGYVPEAPPLAPAPSASRPDFNWLYADGAPLAAVLASLTLLETQVRRRAHDALQRQAEKVGTSFIHFDKIGPMAVAAANTVAPGAVYEARLFLTQSSPVYNAEMSIDGQPITLGPSGEGRVEFRVGALPAHQPDTVRAQWQGLIKLQSYLGDTTLRLAVPYFIVKPRS